MRKTLSLLLFVGLVITAWSAPNFAGPTTNNLVIGTTQEPSNLNPWEGAADTKENVMSLFFIGLTYFDSDGNLQPGLATEVPSADNGRLRVIRDAAGNFVRQEVDWTLRPNANWSDGRSITCADAEFTFEVQNTPDLPVTTRAFSNLINSVTCKGGSRSKSFTIVYQQPNLFFANIGGSIGLTRFYDIAPKHIWEPIVNQVISQLRTNPEQALGDFLGADPATGLDPSKVVGSGPFKVEEWQRNQFIRLSRRSDFFLPPPGPARNYVREITVRFIVNQPTLLSAIIAGEIDASDDIGLAGLEPEVLRRQLGNRAEVEVAPSGFIEKLNFNLFEDDNGLDGRFPGQVDCRIADDLQLADPRTRQAIIQAIDREDLGSTVFPGAIVSNSFVVRGDVGFNEALPTWPFNPDAAQALLAELGWADSDNNGVLERTTDGGRVVEFRLPWVSTTASFRVRTGEILQEFLADVGIALEVQNLPGSVVFSSEFLYHQSECTWGGIVEYAEGGGIGQAPADPLSNELWANDLLEAPVDPEPENTPLALNGFSGVGISGWINPIFDQLRAQALREFDPAKRAEIVKILQQIYATELPTVPLYERVEVVTKKTGLVNFSKITPVARTQFWNAWEWGWAQNGAVAVR
ncbi:MAG: peptide ABC transporter substrate-binding protein [Candidatus Bipolaricaulia bacterium]